MINIIAAVSENGVIGKDGKLPWQLKEDMKRFKALTWGNTVIMGANTYREIGKPLDGRSNIIVSSTLRVTGENIATAPSLEEAINLAKTKDKNQQIFICGGEQIYRQSIDVADRIYITRIQQNFEGDRFFPPIPEQFIKVSEITVEDGNIKTTFCEYIDKRLQ